MFNVGDKVKWNNQEWFIERACLFGGWVLRHAHNGYSTAIVTDSDLEMITPEPPTIQVYAVCDEKGNVKDVELTQVEAELRVHELAYSIRPATLILK